MTELYILEGIKEEELTNLAKKKNSEFITFDYKSHKKLLDRNIHHKLIDDYITDLDRREIFDFSIRCLKKIEEFNGSVLTFHDINLVNLIDRGELHGFLMNIIPKIKVVGQILQNNNYEKIFLASNIYEIFVDSRFKENIRLLNTIQDEFMSFEKIDIPIELGILKTKITIDRSKYKIIKHVIEKCIGNFFGLRKNDKKKIVLLEFNPEVYHDLLKEINRRGFQPVLINFRRSPIFNFKTIRYLIKSKSAIMFPKDWLEKVELEEFEKNKINFFNKMNEVIKNEKIFLNFDYKGINFSSFLQKKLNRILIQRLDEYIMQILIAESIKSRSDIQGIVTLNFSGETEKVFSYVQEKIPILYLQHGFANYIESTSHFDVLDDFHLIKNKIAVWGDIIKDYLIRVKAIPENKIIVSGSPKYDSFSRIEKNKKRKKIMLVTIRPITMVVEGPRIELYEKYKNTLDKLILISNNIENLEIIFKLHPQQNPSNQIIIDMIKKNNKIKILQFNPIKELLSDCDLHVNIAPDNFDASTVILEAMIMGKPTLNIQLQKNEIEFEFMKAGAIKTINYDSNIKEVIFDLISHHGTEELINNSQNFLNKYMKNRGNAAKKLIDSIEDLMTRN
jgi:hypothetical protein